MGSLVDAFIKTVYPGNSTTPEAPTTDKEAFFSFSFRIEATPESIRQRKKALTAIVTERNKLIHKWLAKSVPAQSRAAGNWPHFWTSNVNVCGRNSSYFKR
jgi:hypothetical protein